MTLLFLKARLHHSLRSCVILNLFHVEYFQSHQIVDSLPKNTFPVRRKVYCQPCATFLSIWRIFLFSFFKINHVLSLQNGHQVAYVMKVVHCYHALEDPGCFKRRSIRCVLICQSFDILRLTGAKLSSYFIAFLHTYMKWHVILSALGGQCTPFK